MPLKVSVNVLTGDGSVQKVKEACKPIGGDEEGVIIQPLWPNVEACPGRQDTKDSVVFDKTSRVIED